MVGIEAVPKKLRTSGPRSKIECTTKLESTKCIVVITVLRDDYLIV